MFLLTINRSGVVGEGGGGANNFFIFISSASLLWSQKRGDRNEKQNERTLRLNGMNWMIFMDKWLNYLRWSNLENLNRWDVRCKDFVLWTCRGNVHYFHSLCSINFTALLLLLWTILKCSMVLTVCNNQSLCEWSVKGQ